MISRSLLFLLILSSAPAFGQLHSARAGTDSIVHRAKGIVGVAVVDFHTGDTMGVRGHDHFPMQSVYKFPLALAVLGRVDKGTFSLDQKIYLKKDDLLPNTWSPLREEYPNGDVNIALDELLSFTVSQSDNNGCDILFRLLGGPAAVDRYVHNLGITEMAIVATEEEMHKDWAVQCRNWASPVAMAQLLARFAQDSILSAANTKYLWNLMVKTSTASGRLSGQLPAGTTVAHKTGSSATNANGITAATNDVGIVTLPDGRRFVIVIFVSDSPDNEHAREAIIAGIARVVWDSYAAH